MRVIPKRQGRRRPATAEQTVISRGLPPELFFNKVRPPSQRVRPTNPQPSQVHSLEYLSASDTSGWLRTPLPFLQPVVPPSFPNFRCVYLGQDRIRQSPLLQEFKNCRARNATLDPQCRSKAQVTEVEGLQPRMGRRALLFEQT